jgi:2-aminoadipate transaminase
MTTSTQTFGPGRPALVRALKPPKGFGDITLRQRRPDAIELTSGVPDPELLPTAELSEALTRVLAVPGAPALQYGRTEGLPVLREWIAAREGVPVERILVTNGGFHGLSLAISLVVERGAQVAVDNPVFPLFLRGLELSDAEVLPVSVGADGIDTGALQELLENGARPSAVYTVPDFHNPSQGSLPNEGRRKLVELAERYGFIVFADNPYRELRFTEAVPDDAIFNNSEYVIHINTFTKTLGPGLRLGWVVLPEHLVADAAALRARQDSHSSLLVQAGVAELVADNDGVDNGAFDRILTTARSVYRRRAEALAGALESVTPGEFDVTVPGGGFFVWPRLLDDTVDAEQLAEDAADEGVEYQRGSYFASGPGTDSARHLRLNFSSVPEEKLVRGVERLARALERQR